MSSGKKLGLLDICQRLCVLVMMCLCVVIFVVSFAAKNKCQLQPHIPYWNMATSLILLFILIVQTFHITGLLDKVSSMISPFFEEKLSKNRKEKLKILRNHGTGFVYVTLFIWFMPGTVWIFGNVGELLSSNNKDPDRLLLDNIDLERPMCDMGTFVLGGIIIIVVFAFSIVKMVTKVRSSMNKFDQRRSGIEVTKNPLPERYRKKKPESSPVNLDIEGQEDAELT